MIDSGTLDDAIPGATVDAIGLALAEPQCQVCGSPVPICGCLADADEAAALVADDLSGDLEKEPELR